MRCAQHSRTPRRPQVEDFVRVSSLIPHLAANVNEIVVVCPWEIVMRSVTVPSVSCHASIVYRPGRRPLITNVPFGLRDSKERMRDDADERRHPRTNVGRERNHHFRLREDSSGAHPRDWLPDVERWVQHRLGVDIVQHLVLVHDRERLPYLHTEHARFEPATPLRYDYGVYRCFEIRPRVESLFHVDEHISKPTRGVSHDGFIVHVAGGDPRALGIGVYHPRRGGSTLNECATSDAACGAIEPAAAAVLGRARENTGRPSHASTPEDDRLHMPSASVPLS